LIDEEIDRITDDTISIGETPTQTLSRVLQELPNEGIIYFLGHGRYLLANLPIPVEEKALPEDVLDLAVKKNMLAVSILPTDDQRVLTRRRIGQDRIRQANLENSRHHCALCDVNDDYMLVAGHIARWADEIEGWGDLTNLICM
jgi:hypothetical protein